ATRATPQLVGAALGQGFGLGGEPLEAGFGPGGGTAWRGQALGDEQGADAVLDSDAAADEGLAVGAQGTPLARRWRRQADGRQLTQGLELGQTQRVVAVGLAFEVLELPGGAGGVGDTADHAPLGAEVMDPAGEQAGFDDDDGRPATFEELTQA